MISLRCSSILFLLLEYIYVVCVSGNGPQDNPTDNRCTKIQRTEKLSSLYESGPCVTAYKARCGWFSLDLCTFYKKEICDKNSNVTQHVYSTVRVCCDGFIEAPNGTCISRQSADPQWIKDITDAVYVNIDDIPTSTVSKSEVQKEHQFIQDDKPKLSAGALAGAGCGALFVLIIIAFVVIGLCKRRKRRPKKTPKTDKEEAGMTMLTST